MNNFPKTILFSDLGRVVLRFAVMIFSIYTHVSQLKVCELAQKYPYLPISKTQFISNHIHNHLS